MIDKLQILSASAGSGKTSSLTDAIVNVIKSGVSADRVMATTFTVKAANELLERVRGKLLDAGYFEAATRILDGYVGTMNSVFGRLLREFALEIGLSPMQTVLPDNEAQLLFNSVAANVMDEYYRRYASVIHRLQMENWQKTVVKVLSKARQNGMSAKEVSACADSSWLRLKHFLPEVLPDGEVLNRKLAEAMNNIRNHSFAGDSTVTTTKVIAKFQSIDQDWQRRGEISWVQWAQLSKLNPAKASQAVFAMLTEVASQHSQHPLLHQDIQDGIKVIFYAAAEAMDRYALEKAKRGMVDFTDQESLALQLLSDPQYEEALRERISHVFVDEFQDSSPLQLTLIARLSNLVEGSTWVGDMKQAIFGFRGTDPELMTDAMATVGEENIRVLGASYRSRKTLVELVNSAFAPVFSVTGIPKERVILDAKREDLPDQRQALEVWYYMNSQNKETDVTALAIGIQQMLQNAKEYLVVDKITSMARAITPQDVAVLCRTNSECLDVANALKTLGIQATVGASGLLITPEVVLSLATFRYLIDPRDTLALAEILHFSSDEWGNGRWFSKWLEQDEPREAFHSETLVTAIDEVRETIDHLSPSEILDLALAAAKVDEVVLAWGQGDQRLANLDALRRLVTEYEDSCELNTIAATAGGFLLFVQEVSDLKDSEGNRLADGGIDHAVQVLTYHKAKGLEWPVVILSSLSTPVERKLPPVFNQPMVIKSKDFSMEEPLSGRSLYYWPWPYGDQTTNVGLDATIQGAPELEVAKKMNREEAIRLMYVGMTRARDYLIFATREPNKTSWLQELKNEQGQIIFQLPNSSVEPEIHSGNKEFTCTVRQLTLGDVTDSEQSHQEERSIETEVYVANAKDKVASFLPSNFQPSKVKQEKTDNSTIELVYDRVVEIGSRIPITGSVEMADLGDMVHTFLAADHQAMSREQRLELANDIQERFHIHVVTAAAMVETSDRLARFISDNYPMVASIHREWPMHLRQGLQRASGWMDMVLDTPDGWVIIDHKTFPGAMEKWVDKASSYLPQLQTYSSALKKATGRQVLETWIHLPIVGAMVGFKV